MKKQIFWQTFVVLLLSILLLFSASIWAVDYNNRHMIEERLACEAGLLAAVVRTPDSLERLKDYHEDGEYRITVINSEGNVLYDSVRAATDNHTDREEIRGALSGTPHAVERYSETFGCRMAYYAMATEWDNGEIIVLRLGVPSREIDAYLIVATPLLLIALCLALLITAWLSARLSRRLSHKINRIAASLRSLQKGAYRPLRTSKREPEFYAVLQAINEVNEQILRHILVSEREKEKLNTVLDNVSQGIIALDPFENIVFANNSALTMFGGSHEDIGRHLFYLIDDSALCTSIGSHTKDGGGFEHTLGDRELSVVVRRIEDENLTASVACIVIVTDITRERHMAKEKSDFFANASHELKTPITVMQGLTELLLARDNLDDAARKQVERIHKESLRMADLISDMLKLSHLERRDEEAPPLPVNLQAVADEVVAELTPSMQVKGLTVTVTGQGTVSADPKRIYELVANLCSNAVNYNKEGGRVEITIDGSEAHTVLTVADTGIGIAEAHLPRLCERFYRVDKSRSKKTGGTGLGLAIVKHICVLYGAELTIESTPDIGTKVTVTFPNS